MIDIKKMKSLYTAEDSEKDREINLIIQDYLYRLHKKIQKREYVKNLCPDYLKVICEAYELLEDKEMWIEDIYILLTELKKDIFDQKVYINLSLFGGLCDISYTMNYLCKKTEHFYKFQVSLQKIIVDGCKNILKTVTVENSGVSAYDLIQGLAGILEYMLECLEIQENIKIIQEVIEKLISISVGDHVYRMWNVPNFHISQENQFRDDEKLLYKEGNINFGVAHGIVSILAVLAKAKKLGIRSKNLDCAIYRILDIYMQFGRKSTYGYMTWPEQVGTEDYLANREYRFQNDRQSWCYGPLGISLVLYRVARELNKEKLKKDMENNVIKIAEQNIEKYQLMSPIICHGYAGVVLMFVNMYQFKKSEKIYNRINELLNCILKCYKPESTYGFKDTYIELIGEERTVIETDKDSFLEGASGIILTLLSTKKSETMFDKVLLIK